MTVKTLHVYSCQDRLRMFIVDNFVFKENKKILGNLLL